LELNRKLVTVILVAVIIIVPVSALLWVSWGPTQLDDLTIESISPDVTHVDGVLILATASGSGSDFSEKADLQVKFEAEQVYSGKVQFDDGYLAYKLLFEEFSVGNGNYQFRIIYAEFSDTYDFELNIVAERLGIVAAASHSYEATGVQPWEAVYVYHVVFTTDWNFFTHKIGANEFASYQLGTLFKGDSRPLKVQTEPDFGCTVEIWFTNMGGQQSRIEQYVVDAGDNLDKTLNVNQNGSYLYKYVNTYTTEITIKAYEDRAVDKIPSGGEIEILQELGVQNKIDNQLISEIDQVSGYIKPSFGPGEYDITISYPNPQVKPSSDLSTLSSTDTELLNDLPKANPKANPSRISTLQRTITYDATDSFDDGPMNDLYVYWSFGSNLEGEIGAAEGPWEDYKTYTFTYPFGEDPDVVNGLPFLILKDAYGAESAIAYVNIQVG
jgi:hypothetical protein